MDLVQFQKYWMIKRKTMGYLFFCSTIYLTHRTLCIIGY